MKEYVLENVEQMRAWARDFAATLSVPCVVALHGDLGMGKSEIARTVIQTLRGADTVVPSPTFTIVQEYDGERMPFYHFDVYRLETMDDLYDIGWEDYISQGGVCVVEWADIIRDELSLPYYEIRITKSPESEDARQISIEYKGENQ